MEKSSLGNYTYLMEKNMERESQAPLLFTLGANPNVSHEVSILLNLPLSPNKITHFADGETFAKPLCPVNGHPCIIIHSTFNPVSARLMDLLVFVDALKNAHETHREEPLASSQAKPRWRRGPPQAHR